MKNGSAARDGYWAGQHDRPLVLVAAGTSWDGIKGSDRHLAEALAVRADILWVDLPESPATPARWRETGSDSGRRCRPKLSSISPEIVRLSPVAPPGWSRVGIRSLTWPAVRAQIRWAVHKTRRRPDVFVACHLHDLLGRWGEQVIDVLYGTDDWVAGAKLLGQNSQRLKLEERRALARADVVLTVGTELARRWRELGADPILFPNGCDPECYRSVPDTDPAPIPPGFPMPVAGVVGQLNERINISMLTAVADTGIGLLLVGPCQGNWSSREVEGLLSRPNVHRVGSVPFEDLPRWLARIDVGLTPYADSAFNRASFPLKTLEYLAAGLPVVSTDLPASRLLREESRQVWIAGDGESFAAAVLDAASVPASAEVVRERRSTAERHSWATRADEFARLAGLAA